MNVDTAEFAAISDRLSATGKRVVRLEGAVGDLAAKLGELLAIAEQVGAEARTREQRSRRRHGMYLVKGERS